VIVVAATIDFADKAARDAAVAESAPVQMATRVDEPGCQFYCFAADPSVDTRIQVYELWDDGPTLAAHFKHPNYAAMVVVLRKHGITNAWNRMYLVEKNEPVYAADGTARESFFVD
jgi:quinol monooxygenase YgiN